jgi:acyl dehydratase
VTRSWTSDDAILYALSVGAGPDELAFVTENTEGCPQAVLPTFATIVGMGNLEWRKGIGTFDLEKLVQSEQSFQLHRRIPVCGTLTKATRVVNIYDKGSGALIETQTSCRDEVGEPLMTTASSSFIRGAGGFGGERGGTDSTALPTRQPDVRTVCRTRAEEALLYRLNGARNPIHSDPSVARRAGFQKPILHGLCIYGYVGRVILHEVCGSDPERISSMSARFTHPLFPGEAVSVALWVDGSKVMMEARGERGDVVLIGSAQVGERSPNGT